ncbi:MAG: B12-binding domain-containing radical SAM protein [Candidatus Micrarchaeota archaeon]|nr:B12-binding domain-containing radical SAM protein [Candidatus Micrarchaeota archaeon]
MPSDILLITSSFEENTGPQYSDKEWVRTKNYQSHYPMGIAYLHAYMEKQGHAMRMLFLNTHGYEACYAEVEKAIAERAPDILGLQILTQNRTSSFHILETVHAAHPNVRLVIGGIHTTAMYKQILQKFPYVVAVLGEGELTFDELANALKEGKSIEQIEGIAYFADGQVKVTKPRALIENLDDLPFPKHELFFDPERKHSCILTTRGCPFRCSFCALEQISRRVHRKRSVDSVIQEIEYLAKAYPNMSMVWFHDDTLFMDNERVIALCDEIVKRGLNRLQFVCSARIKPVSEAMVNKLVEANFVKVLFGLESGTDEILRRCHKNITQQDTVETFRLFAKTDIEVITFLIVGLAGETWETNLNTAKFIKRLQRIKYNYFNDIGVLMVYPGTEICRLAIEGGQITDDYWLTDKPVPFYTVEHSEAELFAMKKVLLDHIALKRIWTVDGFKGQWDMIPYVVPFAFSQRDKIAKMVGRRLGIKEKAVATVRPMGE